MSKTLIINSSNYVTGSGNKFVYRFPNTVSFQAGSSIGVSSISMYNSTFNIENSRGNNVINIIWLGMTYTLTFEDGYYSVSDINFRIQQFCILNNLYVTSNSGANIVYFIELVVNSVRYSTQINVYAIPTEATALLVGYTKPTSSWSYPSTATTPQIYLATQAFANLLGFSTGTFPSTTFSTTQSFLSTKTPVISPINSYIMTCNLLNSKFSIPNTTFFSLPLSGSLGTLIVSNMTSVIYNMINPQHYNEIIITFYDQNFNALTLHDFDVTITLAILEVEKPKQ